MKLDLYVIAGKKGQTITYVTEDGRALPESDKVRQFIEWLVHRRNRLSAWIGRVVLSLHDYYLKLEDRIDPLERVLKAMASANQFAVHTASPADFYRVLRRQGYKHTFWFSIDFVLTGVGIILTPILAPIPGPNVFLYYPFLRLASHYRALRGVWSVLHSSNVEFKAPPELNTLLSRMDMS